MHDLDHALPGTEHACDVLFKLSTWKVASTWNKDVSLTLKIRGLSVEAIDHVAVGYVDSNVLIARVKLGNS